MKVKFMPQNIEYEIAPGQSVMKLAHEKDLPVRSVCNGMPSCAECRVKIIEGEHNLMPPTSKEISLIGTGHFLDHRRLSCQMQCFGDVVVDLSEQVEKKRSAGNRRPQGNLKTEATEESLAVTGNLIDQDKDLLSETDDSDLDEEGDSGSRSVLSEVEKFAKSRPNRRHQSHKDRKKKKMEKNRNQNRKDSKKTHQT